MQPTKVTPGGEVKIIDSKIFPVTPISAAIVTLKPGGLRELHWHPNADEWQYYITGKGRMTIIGASSTARTMDFQEGDVEYPGMRTWCFSKCLNQPIMPMFRWRNGWRTLRTS